MQQNSGNKNLLKDANYFIRTTHLVQDFKLCSLNNRFKNHLHIVHSFLVVRHRAIWKFHVTHFAGHLHILVYTLDMLAQVRCGNTLSA